MVVISLIIAFVGITAYIAAVIDRNDIKQMLDELDDHEKRIS